MTDPQQLNNLVDDPAHRVIRDHLARELHRRLEETNDPFLLGPELLAHFGLTTASADREAHIND